MLQYEKAIANVIDMKRVEGGILTGLLPCPPVVAAGEDVA
jgi:hypothetical protein